MRRGREGVAERKKKETKAAPKHYMGKKSRLKKNPKKAPKTKKKKKK